ncbi:MAG: fatty acid desaturase [Deltaproteobacteria bacterium]|nr:fatty acid desaturase [Deltaproteobacteria bacterium]
MSTATIDTTSDSGRADHAGARQRVDTWLLHHHADRRQIGIVTLYLAIVLAMYFVPACRNVPMFLAACALSFLNAVVIHNHLHKGIFKSKTLNRIFRCVLSFGALYPASANIASHNVVHHHFDDDGQPDWAAPQNVSFRWHLLNLLHFPNVAGPNTFAGVTRWATTTRQADFRRQYLLEQVVAFGLTGVLLAWDFWAALFFVVMPQLWGARGILRINLLQHDGCDTESDWNHSRNFVGRAFNWVMCNNGYHTIHHNRAGLHWSVLAERHARECVGRVDPRLDEPSMLLYLLRTFVLRVAPPSPLALTSELRGASSLASRDERKAQASADAIAD